VVLTRTSSDRHVVARKRGLIEFVPDVEWLKRESVEFDFLDFDEAERLLAAARGSGSSGSS